MLVSSRKSGKKILIGDDVEVVVLEVEGDRVKLGFVAPRYVPIFRAEIHEKAPRIWLRTWQSLALDRRHRRDRLLTDCPSCRHAPARRPPRTPCWHPGPSPPTRVPPQSAPGIRGRTGFRSGLGSTPRRGPDLSQQVGSQRSHARLRVVKKFLYRGQHRIQFRRHRRECCRGRNPHRRLLVAQAPGQRRNGLLPCGPIPPNTLAASRRTPNRGSSSAAVATATAAFTSGPIIAETDSGVTPGLPSATYFFTSTAAWTRAVAAALRTAHVDRAAMRPDRGQPSPPLDQAAPRHRRRPAAPPVLHL